MSEELVTIVVALISVIGGAGFWNWMQKKSQLSHDSHAAEAQERNEFRETLKIQVDRLADQVNTLFSEKEALLREVAELQAKVAAQDATIKHLEEALRNR